VQLAAPDEVRGRKVGHVELPEDAAREALSELASRRDQLKHMIHAETCRLGTVRLAELRQAITAHLEALGGASGNSTDGWVAV
jgi:transposase